MKAKLILKKHNDCYSLNDYREPSKGYPLVIAHSGDENFRYKLSKQNCDEIFGVVNVEKLAEEFVNDLQVASESVNRAVKLGYEEGFNKAMELNKNKVFTLSNLRKAFNSLENHPHRTFTELVALLQPTEIEVEIEMRPASLVYKTGEILPKLDSSGCLILTKKILYG